MATALQSGLFILPITLSSAFASFLSGVFVHRTGHYLPNIYVGGFFLVLGNAMYATLKSTTPMEYIWLFQLLAGIGAGCLFAPPLIALQAGVKKQSDIATATSMFGFVRNISAATSIVIGGTAFRNEMDGKVKVLAANGLPPVVAKSLSGGNAAASVETVRKLVDPIQRQRVQTAYADSLRTDWIIYAGLAGVVIFAAFFVKGQKLADEHQETKTGLKELENDSQETLGKKTHEQSEKKTIV